MKVNFYMKGPDKKKRSFMTEENKQPSSFYYVRVEIDKELCYGYVNTKHLIDDREARKKERKSFKNYGIGGYGDVPHYYGIYLKGKKDNGD